jgi:hypothetical protein
LKGVWWVVERREDRIMMVCALCAAAERRVVRYVEGKGGWLYGFDFDWMDRMGAPGADEGGHLLLRLARDLICTERKRARNKLGGKDGVEMGGKDEEG